MAAIAPFSGVAQAETSSQTEDSSEIIRKKAEAAEEYSSEEAAKEAIADHGAEFMQGLKKSGYIETTDTSVIDYKTMGDTSEYLDSETGLLVGGVLENDEYTAHIEFKLPSEYEEAKIFVQPQVAQTYARVVPESGEPLHIRPDGENGVEIQSNCVARYETDACFEACCPDCRIFGVCDPECFTITRAERRIECCTQLDGTTTCTNFGTVGCCSANEELNSDCCDVCDC